MNKKVNWGIIGAGGIADRRTIPGMLLCDNAQPVALMEVNEDRAKELSEKYNVKYYTTLEEILADDLVEAVYIASPVIFHKEQIMAAAKAGKHVLCEKPLCITAKDSAEATKICKDSNVLAATGFMMRYHSLHIKMKELIKEGKIGQVVSCRAQMNCWYPGVPGAWHQDPSKSGGGALIDLGIHCIDILEFITDSKCTETFGFCETKTFSYAIDDSSNVLLKLSNSATAYIDVNFNVPDDACPCRLEIYGTKGSIIAEGTLGQEDIGTLKCVFSNQEDYDADQVRTDAETVIFETENYNLYEKEITAFSNSILEGSPINVPMDAAVHVQNVVEAAYESSKNSSVLKIKY